MTGYLQTRSPDFVSEDGDSTYLAVSLKPTDDKELQEAGSRINDELAGEPNVAVGGYALATEQVNKQVEDDLRTAEMLAFPVLFLLTFIFFRSGVAAMLPLMVGGLAIVGTFLLLGSAASSARSRSSPSTSPPASGSAWRSTTACSWSRATARRSPSPGRGWRR